MRNDIHRTLWILAIGVLVVITFRAESAYAFNQDWEGLEDDWSMPTTTGGVPSAPTTMTCAAWQKNGQNCRECKDAYRDDGTVKGYKVCAWVASSSACYCNNPGTPNCKGLGVCDYWP